MPQGHLERQDCKVNTSEAVFQKYEAHVLESAFFYELVDDREVISICPRGVLVPKLET